MNREKHKDLETDESKVAQMFMMYGFRQTLL